MGRSTLEAIELSERPIAITHANPTFFEPALRNKSDDVLRTLGESGGMLGFSLSPSIPRKDRTAPWNRSAAWSPILLS